MELSKNDIHEIISQRVFRRYQWYLYGILGGILILVFALDKAFHPKTIIEGLPIIIPLSIIFIPFMIWWVNRTGKEVKIAMQTFEANPIISYEPRVSKDAQKINN